eukprot:6480322-Amphidinium_carterae.1
MQHPVNMGQVCYSTTVCLALQFRTPRLEPLGRHPPQLRSQPFPSQLHIRLQPRPPLLPRSQLDFHGLFLGLQEGVIVFLAASQFWMWFCVRCSVNTAKATKGTSSPRYNSDGYPFSVATLWEGEGFFALRFISPYLRALQTAAFVLSPLHSRGRRAQQPNNTLENKQGASYSGTRNVLDNGLVH